MKKPLIILIPMLLLAACWDGIPDVKDFTNVKDGVEVDGKKMTKTEFIQKYCQKPSSLENDSCIKVRRASRMASISGGLPKGW